MIALQYIVRYIPHSVYTVHYIYGYGMNLPASCWQCQVQLTGLTKSSLISETGFCVLKTVLMVLIKMELPLELYTDRTIEGNQNL